MSVSRQCYIHWSGRHRHGQHTGAETGTDTALADTFFDYLEEGAQEAVGSGYFLVERIIVRGQQLVGEVVVFVYQDVNRREVMGAGICQDFLEHLCGIFASGKLKVSEKVTVVCHHDFHGAAIQNIEVLLQPFHAIRHHHFREVVAGDHVPVALRCGMASDVCSAKEILKPVGQGTVVIMR